jgi:hypothetical protein
MPVAYRRRCAARNNPSAVAAAPAMATVVLGAKTVTSAPPATMPMPRGGKQPAGGAAHPLTADV